MRTPSAPESGNTNTLQATPAVNLSKMTRTSVYASLLATALSTTTCSDPEPPVRGQVCVSILDQRDNPMTGCVFDYEVDPKLLAEEIEYYKEYPNSKRSAVGYDLNSCKGESGLDPLNPEEENNVKIDQLNIYGEPGQYKIKVRCDQTIGYKLAGYINVDLDEGKNPNYESRLIGSCCFEEGKYVADPQFPVVKLAPYLGFNDDLHCANWFDRSDSRDTEVIQMALTCGDNENCNPNDGRDYLQPMGNPGEFSGNNEPLNLMLKANTDLVPANEEAKVDVTLRYDNYQEITVPVRIRGRVCGNGVIESGENCEGTGANANFDNVTCQDLGFANGGALKCVDCQRSTENCIEIE